MATEIQRRHLKIATVIFGILKDYKNVKKRPMQQCEEAACPHIGQGRTWFVSH